MTSSPFSFFALLCLAAGLGLAGCDDQIDTPDSLRGTYTLWGALDPTADVQSLRVVPVTDTIGRGTAAPLPVTVVSLDLATGAETAWRDSVVTFRDGSVGHVYRAALRPAYGSRHRVVVRRDAGGEVSAIVAVPPYVEIVRQTAQLSGGVRYPVLWPGAPQVNRVRVSYLLQSAACEDPTVLTRTFSGPSGPVEFGWQTVLDLDEESRTIQMDLGPRVLRGVTITGEVASEDWRPPGGVFDFDVLAEPSALGNVDGGFGFVGAAYDVSVSFLPTFDEMNTTTFLNAVDTCP
jgi:hypothetical protein